MHAARTFIAPLLLCLAATGMAMAAPVPGKGLDGHDNKTLRFLASGDIDLVLVLAPAPEAGSATTQAELAELRQYIATRTPARLKLAQEDADIENVTAFEGAMGRGFDLARLPATSRLFADLRNDTNLLAKQAKDVFKRPRPWELDAAIAADPALDACDKGGSHSSYPSGHSLMGYTSAELLARLVPARAPFVLARAREYAESRLVCAVHFRSDTEASQALAAATIEILMAKPAFRAEFDTARAELAAARLAD